ncbi:hypothetical protein WJX74_004088 [Apatococcus lobatus]|uniref:AP2/ERF domain-containing protein n=1 Tax=Apatococcus lobatus TaxID=904363 RepID=A0AAW1Q2Z8_9CHLO
MIIGFCDVIRVPRDSRLPLELLRFSCAGYSLQTQPSESSASSNAVGPSQRKAAVTATTLGLRATKRQAPTSGKRSRSNCREHGSTEYKGVTRHSNTGRYEAHLWDADYVRPVTAGVKPKRARGRQLYLGAYATAQLAAQAYDKAAIRKWGKGTVTNFEAEDYDDEQEVMASMTFPEYITHLKRGSAGFSRGKSMYRGVTKHHNLGPRSKRSGKVGKWEARIGRVDGGKYKYLGTFETEQEAADAYDRAVIAYRGDQAVTNFPRNQYKRELTQVADTADPDFLPSHSSSSASLALSRRSSCSTQSLMDFGQAYAPHSVDGSTQVQNNSAQRRLVFMGIEASDPAWDLDFDDWLDGVEIATPRMQYDQTVEILAGIDVDFDERVLQGRKDSCIPPLVKQQIVATATAMSPRTVGIVFDIDGVLIREKAVLPGARQALQMVTEAGIPHIFVTNGGLADERTKAQKLTSDLGLPVDSENVVVCHSSLREDAQELQHQLVLVTGRCNRSGVEILQGYGYENVRSLEEFAACHPSMVPHKKYLQPTGDVGWAQQPVAAVVCMELSQDWHQDLQVILDLCRSDGRQGSLAADGQQPVRLYHCNQDFTFPASHPQPRLGPGAFLQLLQDLFLKTTGRQLRCRLHGKPNKPTYVIAEQKLGQQLGHAHGSPSSQDLPTDFRVFAIGDNPKSDMRGANNAGQHWCSILVRTGIWEGGENDLEDPADYVVEDVLAAVNLILASAQPDNHSANQQQQQQQQPALSFAAAA